MTNPLKVIDISLPLEEILDDLLAASREQGFLFIDGHGIAAETADELFSVSKQFFTSVPENEKLESAINPMSNIGYTHYDYEQLDPKKSKDFKECYNFGHIDFNTGEFNQPYKKYYGTSEDPNPLCLNNTDIVPKTPKVFENEQKLVSGVLVQMFDTATKIMSLVTHALEIEDKTFFTAKMRKNVPSGSTLRMIRYPLLRTATHSSSTLKTPKNDNLDEDIRAGAHTDYGALAMLFQQKGQQGLELEINGVWHKVPYVESKYKGMAPPLVINFGDLLSFWTNGLLKSTTHRVKFKPHETRNTDRYSIVMFVHPERNTTLDPVPSSLIPEFKKNEKPLLTAYEHLQKRLQDTYNW